MKWREALKNMDAYHPGKSQPGMIKLSSNENPLGPSPKALAAHAAAAADIHIYPPMVSEELRTTIAGSRRLEANQVIVGNGSDEVFTLCAASLLEPGLNAVSSEHVFSQYQFATRLFGAEYIAVPMKNLRFDLKALAAAVNKNTRILYITSPNNPTGELIETSAIAQLLESIPEHVLLVVDHAYLEYADDPGEADAAKLLDKYPNLLVTGTFSKAYGLAALRIGYGLARAEIISQLEKTKMPFNSNGPALSAARAAMSDLDFVLKSRTFNSENKRSFESDLTSRNISYLPGQGNFLCVKSPLLPASKSAEALASEGIIVRELASFGLPDYLRITIGDARSMEKIASVLGSL